MLNIADATSAAARTLVAAFAGNPFYEALVKGASESDRGSRLEAYFVASIEEGGSAGRVVFATPPEDGVAIWHAPGEGFAVATRAKHDVLARVLPPAGYASYRAIGRHMGAYARGLVSAETWYLSILGVHPARQGAGIGAALLAGTLAELDAAGEASYLETFTTEAVRFYERIGYRTVGETEEPTLHRRYWAMRRDAAA